MSKASEKVLKNLPDFASEVAGLSVEDLNTRLCQIAKDTLATTEAQDADEALQAAKETAKELGAPYRETKTTLRLKSTYIVELLREKGAA